jgi:hypothetical protein
LRFEIAQCTQRLRLCKGIGLQSTVLDDIEEHIYD